jgi:hypothetical protein
MDKPNENADANSVNLDRPWSIEHWTAKLGVSEAMLRDVIGRVGADIAAVRAELRTIMGPPEAPATPAQARIYANGRCVGSAPDFAGAQAMAAGLVGNKDRIVSIQVLGLAGAPFRSYSFDAATGSWQEGERPIAAWRRGKSDKAS